MYRIKNMLLPRSVQSTNKFQFVYLWWARAAAATTKTATTPPPPHWLNTVIKCLKCSTISNKISKSIWCIFCIETYNNNLVAGEFIFTPFRFVGCESVVLLLARVSYSAQNNKKTAKEEEEDFFLGKTIFIFHARKINDPSSLLKLCKCQIICHTIFQWRPLLAIQMTKTFGKFTKQKNEDTLNPHHFYKSFVVC